MGEREAKTVNAISLSRRLKFIYTESDLRA